MGVNYRKIALKHKLEFCENHGYELHEIEIHHRRDTLETIEYNDSHYKYYGCEEDGTFILGKYVEFLTIAQHKQRHKGDKRKRNQQIEIYKDGMLITIASSKREAAIFVKGDDSNVNKVLKRRRKHVNGFTFKIHSDK